MTAILLGGVGHYAGGAAWAAEASPIPGVGAVRINGLLQGWYVADGAPGAADTFRLRRAEIRLSGRVAPEVGWFVMVDPAKSLAVNAARDSSGTLTSVEVNQAGRILQDFGITLNALPGTDVVVGQGKVPFGMEGLALSGELDTVERSAMATVFRWTDFRDVGVQMKGDYALEGVTVRPTVGVFNGDGQNVTDSNEHKDLAGRLVVDLGDPLGWTGTRVLVGGAHYQGRTGKEKSLNVRSGAELSVEHAGVKVAGEFAAGRSGGTGKRTWYGLVGYTVTERVQPVARFDWWDPDTEGGGDIRKELTVGLNSVFVNRRVKAQVNYVARWAEGGITQEPLWRVNLQTIF